MTCCAGYSPLRLILASLILITAISEVVRAAGVRTEPAPAPVEWSATVEPIMAIISLRDQQIRVYTAGGLIMRAPVSSGQKGRETPAGIFSVIQKQAEHDSNLYDDAYMPHMQRLTWSGVALHGGVLPGHAASHGCIRLPYDFAERLFDVTRLEMRVIVASNEVQPVAIAHPVLFRPNPDTAANATALAAEADLAASKVDQARVAAGSATQEVVRATVALRAAENQKRRAEAHLAEAQRAVAIARSAEAREQADVAKAKAAAKLAEFEAQVAGMSTELQRKKDILPALREAVVAAETVRTVAAEAARKAARDLEPVSVFISRKTQRLYVRQGFRPILEVPVTIRDADRPIGTHIFTAVESIADTTRWTVVSLVTASNADGAVAERAAPARGAQERDVEQTSTEVSGAKAALDRIDIPQDTLDRLAGKGSPRSALIISDEPLSSETGDGTEFVVLLSGEPQGGIKNPRRGPSAEARYHTPYWRSPFAGHYSTWW
jgi:hypothetical protein